METKAVSTSSWAIECLCQLTEQQLVQSILNSWTKKIEARCSTHFANKRVCYEVPLLQGLKSLRHEQGQMQIAVSGLSL